MSIAADFDRRRVVSQIRIRGGTTLGEPSAPAEGVTKPGNTTPVQAAVLPLDEHARALMVLAPVTTSSQVRAGSGGSNWRRGAGQESGRHEAEERKTYVGSHVCRSCTPDADRAIGVRPR